MRIAEAQRRAASACAMRDKSRLTATDVRRAHAVAPQVDFRGIRGAQVEPALDRIRVGR